MLAFYMVPGSGSLSMFWVGISCLLVMVAAVPATVPPLGKRFAKAVGIAIVLALLGVIPMIAIECSKWIWILCD